MDTRWFEGAHPIRPKPQDVVVSSPARRRESSCTRRATTVPFLLASPSVRLGRSGSKWHATDTSTGSVQSLRFAIAHIGSSNRSRDSSTSSSSRPAPSSSTGASSSSRSTPSPRSSSDGKRYPCCSRSPPIWPPVGPIKPGGRLASDITTASLCLLGRAFEIGLTAR
jgi:hypothetical protein